MPALDGVRGVAIALVVLHTFCGVARESGSSVLDAVRGVALAGWSGVQLFFVLSGFLITGILIDDRDRAGRAGYFRRFYIRRTLRIFPLYYAVLAIWLILIPLSGIEPALGVQARAHGAWYWLYLSNWVNPFGIGVDGLSHFWSLAVEEQFYLIWPLIVATLVRRRLSALCTVLLIATPFVRLALLAAGLPALAPYEFLIARWDALAAGALLAIALRSSAGQRRLASIMRSLTIIARAGIVAMTIALKGFGPSLPLVSVLGQSLVAALSVALVYAAAREPIERREDVHGLVDQQPTGRSRTARVLNAPWLRFLGRYSYGLYVFHLPIHFLLFVRADLWVNEGSANIRLAKLAIYCVAAITLSAGAALVSWKLLEAPCLRLKERLAPRIAFGA
ncbi:MAG: acyltransferase [Gemmatimonadaceae bacterium]